MLELSFNSNQEPHNQMNKMKKENNKKENNKIKNNNQWISVISPFILKKLMDLP
jgi:hypothetical protein